ncbi:MAG: HAMP domain-containing sensor histidine kinase [Candidatus Thermoplasmatota archaeon]
MEGDPTDTAPRPAPAAEETALASRVLDIALAVLYNKDEDRILETIGRSMMTLFPIRKLVIYVTDRSTGEWHIKFVVGYPEDQARDIMSVTYSRDSWDETLQVYRKLGALTYLAPGENVKIDDFDSAFYRGFPQEVPPRESPAHWHMMDFIDTILFDKDGRELGALEILETTDGMIPSKEVVSRVEVLAAIASVALELAGVWRSQEALLAANSSRARIFAKMLNIATRMVSLRRGELILLTATDFLTSELGFMKARGALWDARASRYVFISPSGLPDKEEALTRDAVYRDCDDMFRFTDDLYWTPAKQLAADRPSMMPFKAPGADVHGPDRAGQAPGQEDDRFDLFAVPLRDRANDVVGVIYATDRQRDVMFEKDLLELMSVFSSIISLAFRNSQLIRETVQANEDLDMMNRLLFHDISNYNTGIGSYLDVAARPEASPELKEKAIGVAMKQLELSNELINRIRKLIYIRERGSEKMLTVDLVSTIASLAEEMRAVRTDKKLEITTKCAESQCLVRGNELIHDLFQNLLSNSVKYDPHETVRIDIEIAPVTEEGKRFWDITVADRGVGVPDEKKEQIFERFTPRLAGGKGIGLGLSIVRTIVDKYGGRIWVEDRVEGDPSQGALFHVLLPAV